MRISLPGLNLVSGGRALLALVLSVFIAGPASATWSIVVLNRLTGELAVATSTCIQNFDISRAVPVIRVGHAAGAAQSALNPNASNRRIIFRNSLRGATPQQLLDLIESVDGGFQNRQFGIVSFDGPPVTHSGTSNGIYAGGVTGIVGEYEYAIQGNVLSGSNVIVDCEAAFLATDGDLGERIMAAMEAARDAGGDGRCSCSPSFPTSCGSPPPSFTYASYNAFMAIARFGDASNFCGSNNGCANGDYYMRLNYIGNPTTQEPVAALRDQYTAWRAALVGVPDHIRSTVTVGATNLQADGQTRTRLDIQLVDVDGVPLTVGGQLISVTQTDGDGIATFENHVDNGDGTHSIEAVSTLMAGAGEFAVVVEGGARPVQLYPMLSLTSAQPAELHAGRTTLSSSEAIPVPLYLSLGSASGASSYRVLGSLSGTSPGQVLGSTMVPLNADRFFDFTATWPGGLPFLGNAGSLDASGRAEALFAPRQGLFASMIGTQISFSALVGGSVATAPVSVLVTP